MKSIQSSLNANYIFIHIFSLFLIFIFGKQSTTIMPGSQPVLANFFPSVFSRVSLFPINVPKKKEEKRRERIIQTLPNEELWCLDSCVSFANRKLIAALTIYFIIVKLISFMIRWLKCLCVRVVCGVCGSVCVCFACSVMNKFLIAGIVTKNFQHSNSIANLQTTTTTTTTATATATMPTAYS